METSVGFSSFKSSVLVKVSTPFRMKSIASVDRRPKFTKQSCCDLAAYKSVFAASKKGHDLEPERETLHSNEL